jgi:gluconokinase
MVILLMGVTASGKSTIGLMLAEMLDWNFIDADYMHSMEHIHKLMRGVPLTDDDRQVWLECLQDAVEYSLRENSNLILACSLLKASYRDRLRLDHNEVKIVYLKGSTQLLRQRFRERKPHFMSPSMLSTQLATIEEPQDAHEVNIDQSPEETAHQILLMLDLWDRN